MGFDPKSELVRYLRQAREALVWKLDGLDEYAVRRPMTPTGTNLLGLVKHVASVEAGYLGETFGRPMPEPIPWLADDAPDDADMWATPDESRQDIVDFYRRVWTNSDRTVQTLPLETEGRVPWWPATERPTLHRILVHMIAETNRHAGHADIVRESLDGGIGHRADASNMPDVDAGHWARHTARLEEAARAAAER